MGLGNEKIHIDHSTVSGTSCLISRSLVLHRDYNARVSFITDTLTDVFYARCIDPNGSVVLTVDAY